MSLRLSENALKVLARRYLIKNEDGKVIETPEEMFRRVAKAIAQADKSYGKNEKEVLELQEAFYRIMAELEFMPNSPALMNAGKELGQLSACFSPEQIIITEHGPKPISDVKTGDYVLTHQNRLKKVTEIFTRKADTIYSISAYKLPTVTLKVTAEHPILAIKSKDKDTSAGRWIQVKDLSVGDYIALAYPEEITDVDTVSISDFIKDETVIEKNGYLYEKNEDIRTYVRKDGSVYTQNRNRSGEISRQVKPIKNTIAVDGDLLRLFGYYLSEGCVSENRCLRFVFSLEERHYGEDVLSIVENKFGITSRIEETNSADRKWISIRFHSKILALFFLTLFGTGYNIKEIPPWMILLPIEKQKGLLSGMFRGDSCTFKNGNNFCTKLVMCNNQLVYSAWQILARIGIFASLNFCSMPKLGRTQPVICQVSGKEGTRLINEFLEENFPHNDVEFKREVIYAGRIFTPITKIIRQAYSGIVYNLEVEKDHSYCANMVAVHNCFVLPIEDSMDSIFESLKATAMIHKSGGGCVYKNSNIFTTYCGLEKIEVLYNKLKKERPQLRAPNNESFIDLSRENIFTFSFDKKTGRFSKDKIEKIWHYCLPKERIYSLCFEGNSKVSTSDWHPFFVFENSRIIEKRADEVKSGDWLVFSNNTVLENWPFKEYQEVKGIKVDEDMGWLLGYFLGDGSIGPYLDKLRLRFFDESTEALNKVSKILSSLTGRTYKIQKDTRNKTHYIVLYNSEVIEFIRTVTGVLGEKKEICIPPVIFKSPLTVINAFLAGLIDSDGYISKEKIRVSYATASKKFIDDLSSLLSLFGFRVSVRTKKPRRDKWLVMHELNLDTHEQLARLWNMVGDYIVNDFRKKRLEKFATGSSRYTSRPCSIRFIDIEPYLNKIGIVTKGTGIHRQSVKIKDVLFWLARWKWDEGVSLDKVLELIKTILTFEGKFTSLEKERLKMWLLILPTLQRVIKVKKGSCRGDFYDFSIMGNNNYLSGERGFAVVHNTGFSFSRLRPKNAVVKTTGGIASGPVSFMRVYDAATEAVKQGGTRRGANMGILRVDHPDIMEFITCKENNKEITNFNISVAITDDFMQRLEKGQDYDLIDPHTQKVVGQLNTKEVFDLIVRQAHKNGEPGVIFIDRMNEFNPTPKLGRYESTNPCGEQVLLPYESCDLGSINLALMYKKADHRYEIDWDKLREVTRLAVHFLDNLIDVNKFPLPQIERATKLTRKIGLGIMGWASLLIRLNTPYNSDEAVALAEKIMSFILGEATKKSLELGKTKGVFPAFKGSIYDKREGGLRLRNATLTTIAPTGTISIIAGPCSSGIEPLFAISYYRNVMDNDKLVEVDPLFEEIAEERGFYSRELMEKIAEKSSIRDIEGIPEDVKRVFVTSHDISPQWHVRMQAAYQKHVHNATSKTINFPQEATVEDVRKSYLLAYELRCKGITIYRDRSREEQVLNTGRPRENGKASQDPAEQNPAESKKEIAPRPRPEVIIGTTTKVATGCGNLYVTINVDEEGKPFELFTQMGKAGGCAASQLEATGRLVSLAFRSGIEVKVIIEQLRNIRCPSPSWEKGQRIFSCADAIARVVEKRLCNGQAVKLSVETAAVAMKHSYEDEQTLPDLESRGEIVGVCPDCGGALRHEEGCQKCHVCGFSKC